MATQLGQRLGPYEILPAIGAGGMGEVYRAGDTRLNRIVAIKTLPDRNATKPEFRVRGMLVFGLKRRFGKKVGHPLSAQALLRFLAGLAVSAAS
jgi:serine/threonine protein kinase